MGPDRGAAQGSGERPDDAAGAGSSDRLKPSSPRLRVVVTYAPVPRQVEQAGVDLPAGSLLLDALQASGLLQRFGLVADESLRCGVWGKLRALNHPLRDGDRVECYRPLLVDPKEARRQRYRRQARG